MLSLRSKSNWNNDYWVRRRIRKKDIVSNCDEKRKKQRRRTPRTSFVNLLVTKSRQTTAIVCFTGIESVSFSSRPSSTDPSRDPWQWSGKKDEEQLVKRLVMFLKRGIMRYYRVWIYSCNLALFLATIIFITLFIWLLTDIHLSLFTSIHFYDPTFIYGFSALVLQGGVLQVSEILFVTLWTRTFALLSSCPLVWNTYQQINPTFVSPLFT